MSVQLKEAAKGLCDEDIGFSLNMLKGHVTHKNGDFHCFVATFLMLREKLGTQWVDVDGVGE